MSGFYAVSQYLKNNSDRNEGDIFSILKRDFDNGLRKNNFYILLKKLNLNGNLEPKLVEIYRTHKPTITLYSEVKYSLEILKKNKKLGLISDGLIQTQQNKIDALQIRPYFNHIIINDINKTTKLYPICFKKMIKKLNIEPQESAYIGDNPLKDFYIPNQLGIQTIHIKRNFGEYINESVNDYYQAKISINNLTELINL